MQLHVGYLSIKSSLVLRLSFLGVSLEMSCITITIQGLSPRHRTLCCPDQELSFMPSLVHALCSNFLFEVQTSFSKKLAHESLQFSLRLHLPMGAQSNHYRFNSKTILKHHAIQSFSFCKICKYGKEEFLQTRFHTWALGFVCVCFFFTTRLLASTQRQIFK